MPRKEERVCRCGGTGADGCNLAQQAEERRKAARRAAIEQVGQSIDLLTAEPSWSLLQPEAPAAIKALPIQGELTRIEKPRRPAESIEPEPLGLPESTQPLHLFLGK